MANMKKTFYLFSLILSLSLLASCSQSRNKNASVQNDPMGDKTMNTSADSSQMHKTCKVKKVQKPLPASSDWDAPEWSIAPPIELPLYMGEKPEHFPQVQARVLYDDEAIHVLFRVDDQYVRAVNEETPGFVCRDSCVEFFFTPEEDSSTGYFNIEVNCGGVMLFRHQDCPGGEREDLENPTSHGVEIYHSLPTRVEPEITEPVVWTVAFSLPYEIIKKYHKGFQRPAPGVRWRANFYKCADKTSHPHWLTWSKVDHPTPRFHMPEFFGFLEF
jgi:hypothetical protein